MRGASPAPAPARADAGGTGGGVAAGGGGGGGGGADGHADVTKHPHPHRPQQQRQQQREQRQSQSQLLRQQQSLQHHEGEDALGPDAFHDAVEAQRADLGPYVGAWTARELAACDQVRWIAVRHRSERVERGERVAPEGELYVWGIDVLAYSPESYGVLGKFVNARPTSTAAACAMFSKALHWRAEFLGDDGSSPKPPPTDERPRADPLVALAREVLPRTCYTRGRDPEGRLIIYGHVGALETSEAFDAVFGNQSRCASFQRWRIERMEDHVRQVAFGEPTDTFVQVHDLRNAPLRIITTSRSRAALSSMLSTLNDNYPEFTKSIRLVRMPIFGRLIAAFVRPFTRPGRLYCSTGVSILDGVAKDALRPPELMSRAAKKLAGRERG